MIKEIFDLFRKENPLNQAFERSREMLQHDQEMVEAAIHSLRERDDARIVLDVYAKDQMINAYEREVRRKVFTHLAVAGEKDLNAGLVLVSVIIDIERIGDYAKNIVELAVHHPKRLVCGAFEPDVARMETTTRTMFRLLLECLPGNDEDKAKEVMSEHWWINRKADDIIRIMLEHTDPNVEVREAVATALYVRYLKRISSHLKNVASSVVNPFDRIGYRGDPNGK
jgi:phosphate uptake regulator